MSGDIVFGIRLKYDGKEVTGGVELNRADFKRLAAEATATGKGVADASTLAAGKLGGLAASGATVTQAFKGSAEQGGVLSAAIAKVGHYASAYLVADQVLTFAAAIKDAALEANRLKQTYAFAFGGMAEGAKNLEYVRGTAATLGLELTSASRAYGKLSAASIGTALEGEKTRAIFEAVSKATVVMGLSAEEGNGALMAIQQMMSKGTVQAEELRGQLGERLPGAFQIAARAMGTTTAGLGKMLEAGNVVASDFLPKFAAELERTLGDSAVRAAGSLQAAINRLDGAWQKFKQSLGGTESSQGGGALAEATGWLTRTLEDAAGQMERVGKNGHGLLARMFIGLSAGQANILTGLFGGNANTGEGLVRDNAWMGRQLEEIEKLKRANQAAHQGGNPYQISSTSDELNTAQERYAEAFRARNAAGFKLPDLKAEAAKSTADLQDTYMAIYGAWSADLATHSPVVAARKALEDYKKKYKVLESANPNAYSTGLEPLQRKLGEALQANGRTAYSADIATEESQQQAINNFYKRVAEDRKKTLEAGESSQADYIAAMSQMRDDELTLQIASYRREEAAARAHKNKADAIKYGKEAATAEQARAALPDEEALDKSVLARKQTTDATAIGAALHADYRKADEARRRATELDRMSESERRLAQTLAVVNDRSRAAQEALDLKFPEKERSARAYTDAVKAIKTEQDAAAQSVRDWNAQQDALNASWVGGAQAAARDYVASVDDSAGQARRAWSGTWKRAEDDLTAFFAGGKLNVRGFVEYAINELARIKLAQPLVKSMAGAADGLFGNLFGSASAPGVNVGLLSEAGVSAMNMFAGGGDHAGGWRVVGERGPELEATGPSRIFTADQTRDILSGGNNAPPNIAINITNQIGTQATARTQGAPRWDGGQWVVDVLMERLGTDPHLRAALGVGH